MVADLPPATARVHAVDVLGTVFDLPFDSAAGRAAIVPLPPATYALIAADAAGAPLARELFTVEARPGQAPVPAFASSLGPDADLDAVDAWLRALRATYVQVYDWMASYSAPVPTTDVYEDPLGRTLSRPTLARLIGRIATLGAIAQAYAPVCAADAAYADGHPEQGLYRGDGTPERLGTLLRVLHPGHPEWQRHFIAAYGEALTTFGFRSLHLDTYGFPRAPLDREGRPVDIVAAYGAFIAHVRAALPDALLTFNQVNGHPRALRPPSPPSSRYVEVWPPNDAWRHLEALVARSERGRADDAIVLAVYPPTLATDPSGGLRTAVRTQAIATCLGADTLMWGDAYGALTEAYYPRYAGLAARDRARVLAWHRFGLGVRDLFRRGIDTSWEDVGGVNEAVAVDAQATALPALPEPGGGRLCVRVRRGEGWIAIAVLNLTGSESGRWLDPTAPAWPLDVTLSVQVDRPERWRARLAVVGRDEGRFGAIAAASVAHPGGVALRVAIPALTTWAVALFTTPEARL